MKLATTGDLGDWLELEGLPVESLDEQSLMAFLLTCDRRRRSKRSEATTSRQRLDYLRAAGRILATGPAPGPAGMLERITRRYERFLADECEVS